GAREEVERAEARERDQREARARAEEPRDADVEQQRDDRDVEEVGQPDAADGRREATDPLVHRCPFPRASLRRRRGDPPRRASTNCGQMSRVWIAKAPPMPRRRSPAPCHNRTMTRCEISRTRAASSTRPVKTSSAVF